MQPALEAQAILMKKALVPSLLVLAVVLVFFIYIYRGAIYAEMNVLKLVPQEEHFTELYFDDPSSLLKETVAGQPTSFSFTIHNVEGATTTYPYQVYFGYPFGRHIVFTQGTVTLGDNASTTITIAHTFIENNETGEVVVNLQSLNQQIDFLLPGN